MAKKAKESGRRVARPGGKRPRPVTEQDLAFLVRLGDTLKRRRVDAGVTGAEMATELHLSVSTQFSREAGRLPFPVTDLVKYAKALSCLPSDFVKEAEAAIQPPGSPALKPKKAAS
ncbi:MAG: helix-turn-helix domain-containing protein [Thermoguttaceae bacterium]